MGSELFIKQPVRALLFEGYSDPLLDAAALVPPQLGITIPQGYDKFGWFYGVRSPLYNFRIQNFVII